eukprot:superscaffoldBa00000229_g2936
MLMPNCWQRKTNAIVTSIDCDFCCCCEGGFFSHNPSVYSMRLVWKSLDKMRCLRKRSTIPFLGFLITFLLFLNLYIEDGYVLEEDKRQLRETSVHPPSSERYVHTFRDLSNFSGTINVTYRYLAGTPLNRK